MKEIKDGAISKGDVLAVAQVGGIMGAKRTSQIMPREGIFARVLTEGYIKAGDENTSGGISIIKPHLMYS